jgi:hypothetical protein
VCKAMPRRAKWSMPSIGAARTQPARMPCGCEPAAAKGRSVAPECRPLRSPDALKCSSAQPHSSTAARRGKETRAGEKSDLVRTRARAQIAPAEAGSTEQFRAPRDTTAGTSRQRRFRLADAWTSAHAYSPHLTRPSQSVRPSHSTISLGPPTSTPRTHRTE